jgi:hypothetical protein
MVKEKWNNDQTKSIENKNFNSLISHFTKAIHFSNISETKVFSFF